MTRRKRERYTREIVVDIESADWSRVLCICAVGSDGLRFDTRSVEGLFERLSDNNCLDGRTRVWAHYGGIYDYLLIVPWALRHGWGIARAQVDPGGKLWSCDLTRDGHTLCLRDSSRIMPDSAEKIGVAYGLPKGGLDRSKLESYPLSEVIHYCYRDCDIVLRALSNFRRVLTESGGMLGDTLAGSAARIAAERMHDRWGVTEDVDAVGQHAYAGGRVEVFAESIGTGAVYDINSAYPWAMSGVLPTRFSGSGTGKIPSDDRVYLATATVRVRKDAMYGPLFVRPQCGALKGRLVFPSGEWTGTYTLEELQCAAENGDCDYTVRAWHAFEPAEWLNTLVGKWYAARVASASEAEKYAYKILLNSLYGKFIESPDGAQYTTDKWRAEVEESRGARIEHFEFEGFCIYAIHNTHIGTIRHAPTAAVITGRVRSKLLRAMRSSAVTAYCDTDSIVGNAPIADSTALGEWKLERRIKSGRFVAPKLYRLETDDEPIVKAKGYARGADAVRLWDDIIDGKRVFRDSTVLFRSLVRSGALDFARKQVKRMRREGVQKRCFYATGGSRPWHFDELSAL